MEPKKRNKRLVVKIRKEEYNNFGVLSEGASIRIIVWTVTKIQLPEYGLNHRVSLTQGNHLFRAKYPSSYNSRYVVL